MNDAKRQAQADLLEAFRRRAPFASERELLDLLSVLWRNRRRGVERPAVLEGLDEAIDLLMDEWQGRGSLGMAMSEYIEQVLGDAPGLED